MKGDLRCEGGRLMRHDPQFDDPYLETDCGICPDCGGRGCEPPKAQGISRMDEDDRAMLIHFSKPLSDDEMQDFHDYAREWTP